MRRKFERTTAGAAAAVAALLSASPIGPAAAGGFAAPDTNAPAAQCGGGASQGCPRINGHIAAGSDFAGGGQLEPPPFAAAIGAAGQAAADAINRGLFLLQASHDGGTR